MTLKTLLARLTVCLLACQTTLAFAPTQVTLSQNRALLTRQAAKKSDDVTSKFANYLTRYLAATAAMVATNPLLALAEEVDDYEYGAVNAPIGIAWAAGCLAILTALLPLALQGGEKAFEEMKNRDAYKWGKGGDD